jgi:hypothetical protein
VRIPSWNAGTPELVGWGVSMGLIRRLFSIYDVMSYGNCYAFGSHRSCRVVKNIIALWSLLVGRGKPLPSEQSG